MIRNDPFGGERLLAQLFDSPRSAATIPIDAYRRGDDVWLHLDLPGCTLDDIDVTVDRGVVTVTATRGWELEEGDQLYLHERREGTFRRQVQLGDGLDTEAMEAFYVDGVLTLRIPVAGSAKPRRISVSGG